MELPKHGEFCWTELATDKPEQCREFYTNVFGWEFKPSANAVGGMEYTEFGLPGEMTSGGMYRLSDVFGDAAPPPHFVQYIHVEDVDAAAVRAVELGGSCCHEPQEIPNVGRMVTIKDPTGGICVLINLRS